MHYITEDESAQTGLSFNHIVLICVFVGAIVLAVAAVGIFTIHMKYRKKDHKGKFDPELKNRKYDLIYIIDVLHFV